MPRTFLPLLLLSALSSLVRGASPSTVTLSTPGTPSTYGHVLEMTAAVTPPTATGRVTFYDGVSVLGDAALSQGTAVYSTRALAPGIHTLTACYGGDPNNMPSHSDFNNDGKADLLVFMKPAGGSPARQRRRTGAFPGNQEAVLPNGLVIQ